MGSANSISLPQFDDSDFESRSLAEKMRALVRSIELALGQRGEAEETGADWIFTQGAPGGGQGVDGSFALAQEGDGSSIYRKEGGSWGRLGSLDQGGKDDAPGGSRTTLSSGDSGETLVLEGRGGDLRIRGIAGTGSATVRPEGDVLVIDVDSVVDGGYFSRRRGATQVLIARGDRDDLPLSAPVGEELLANDTMEVFFGAGDEVRAQRIRPENVINLLVGGKINPEYLPEVETRRVYPLISRLDLDDVEAAEGDIAIIRDGRSGREVLVFDDDGGWIDLAGEVAGADQSVRARGSIDQFSVVTLASESDEGESSDPDEVTFEVVVEQVTEDSIGRSVGVALDEAADGDDVFIASSGNVEILGGSMAPGEVVYAGSDGRLTQSRPGGPYVVVGYAVSPTTLRILPREEVRSIGAGVSLLGDRAGSAQDILTVSGDESVLVGREGDRVVFSLPVVDGRRLSLLVDRAPRGADIEEREVRIDADTRELLVGESGQAEPVRVDTESVIDLGCIRLVAGEDLGGHRVVVALSGEWVYASPEDELPRHSIIGVTTAASSKGEVSAARVSGIMSEPSWSWRQDAPVYFSARGILTQSPPASGHVQIVGLPISATQLAVSAEPPIMIEESQNG